MNLSHTKKWCHFFGPPCIGTLRLSSLTKSLVRVSVTCVNVMTECRTRLSRVGGETTTDHNAPKLEILSSAVNRNLMRSAVVKCLVLVTGLEKRRFLEIVFFWFWGVIVRIRRRC